MAFKKTRTVRLNSIRLISQYDQAINEDDSDYEKYAEDPMKNESALVMHPGKSPTYFICNFELTAKQDKSVKNAMLQGFDDEKNANMNYGSWAHEVVRIVLKDIQNPSGETDVIEFKKDGRGYVADSTMDELSEYGIIPEIFNYFVGMTADEKKANAKN